MGALVQTKSSRFASFKAIVSPPRPRLVPATVVSAREPRAFPGASTPPTLPLSIRDETLEYYAFIFCQGGFRPLLQSNRPISRRPARKRGHSELVHASPKERGARSCAMSY